MDYKYTFLIQISGVFEFETIGGRPIFVFNITVKNSNGQTEVIFIDSVTYAKVSGIELTDGGWVEEESKFDAGVKILPNKGKLGRLRFWRDNLDEIEVGDLIFMSTYIAGTQKSYSYSFQCSSIDPVAFSLRSVDEIKLDAEAKRLMHIQRNKKIDITELVDRLEILEQRVGIEISGLLALIKINEYNNPKNFKIQVNFDISSINGDKLNENFQICLTAYNKYAQSLGTTQEYIYNESFLGFDSKSIELTVDEIPSKLRLFPAK